MIFPISTPTPPPPLVTFFNPCSGSRSLFWNEVHTHTHARDRVLVPSSVISAFPLADHPSRPTFMDVCFFFLFFASPLHLRFLRSKCEVEIDTEHLLSPFERERERDNKEEGKKDNPSRSAGLLAVRVAGLHGFRRRTSLHTASAFCVLLFSSSFCSPHTHTHTHTTHAVNLRRNIGFWLFPGPKGRTDSVAKYGRTGWQSSSFLMRRGVCVCLCVLA